MLSRAGQSPWIAVVFFLLCINVAQSRETRQMCVPERIEASDAVFVGKAVAIAEPAKKISGVSRYAVIEVQDVLKGSVPSRVNFVVSGYSAELDPNCCEEGQTYVLFARHGYDVIELSDGIFINSTLGKNEFMSATNGEFSALLVQGGKVTDWQADSDCGTGSSRLADISACVRKLVETSAHRKSN